MTRQERDHIRSEINLARRARLVASEPRLDPDRDPHPRRDYWRNWKAARRQVAT